MAIKSYRDLQVWQKAMDLVMESYRLTKSFSRSETFALSTQIQKAAVSVPANIAEGHGREHLGDYLHHLSIANGSLFELESHFQIAERLSYLQNRDLERILSLTAEVGRMLAGLIRKLKISQKDFEPDT